jgi:hypothetical protein
MTTARDQRIADEVGLEASLRCKARGCPCAWSVNFGTKLCSAHALCTNPSEWPFVTQHLLEDETERARLGPPSEHPMEPLSREEGLTALGQIRDGHLFARQSARGWAVALQCAEAAGKSLSTYQRQAWRTALAHRTLDAAVRGAPVPPSRITDALQTTGDLPTEETM